MSRGWGCSPAPIVLVLVLVTTGALVWYRANKVSGRGFDPEARPDDETRENDR